MSDHDKIIQSGPFKGKRIELASTAGIDRFAATAQEFMARIFALERGEYLITDESSLADFTGVADMDVADIQEKIRNVYGVDVSDLATGSLLEIFVRIGERESDES